MKNKFKNFFEQKGFFVALYSCAAIVVVIAGIVSVTNYNQVENNPPEQIEQQGKIEIKSAQSVDKSNVKSYKETSETTTNTTSQTTTRQTTQTTTTKIAEKETETVTAKQTNASTDDMFTLFNDAEEMSWPVNGKIIMDYSVETSVYDETLEQYRTNDSICISSDIGTEVIAASDGKIENITNDEVKGNSIVINHSNGFMATYSQLKENDSIKIGDTVKEGDVIGYIEKPTKYALELGPHLDFKITYNNETTDPKLLLYQYDE